MLSIPYSIVIALSAHTRTPKQPHAGIALDQPPTTVGDYDELPLSPFARDALHAVSKHPTVLNNPYCEWFRTGKATYEQTRDLVREFSVFSQLFLLAQLRKTINSPTVDEMRASKEILANEIGVVFKPGGAAKKADAALGGDPSVLSVAGSVEGGTYSHRAAHFEWLLDVGSSLGMAFDDLGKRRLGSPATLHFCDKLYEIYGSDNPSVALGASFAIEHWANAGFWDCLVDGFQELNRGDKLPAKVPLGFWRFHQALEAQHAAHTMEELEEAYAEGRVTDERAFYRGATEILDACGVFWAGLDAARRGEPFVLPDSP